MDLGGQDRRLRVGHLTLGLETGGQEKLLVDFARHHDRDRFELVVLSLTGRGRLAEPLEELGVRVEHLDMAQGLQPRMVMTLARSLGQHKLDVLHTHDDKPIVYGAPAASLARVPVRIHTHHHGQLDSQAGRAERMIPWLARLMDRFVCVSQDSLRYFRDEVGVAAKKLLTVHNGIDLERFACHGPDRRGPALAVGRLSPEKGHRVLLDAIPRLLKHCPDFRLELAGEGPLRGDLEKQALNLGIAGQVRFLGNVSNVAERLSHARLFVLPSFTEGISLTLLEAMSVGLPVVATQVGGNPEVVHPAQTGLLVPSNDSQSLAEAIERVWNDPPFGSLLGQAGRSRVESQFDIRAMVARYERLYLHPNADSNKQAAKITDRLQEI